jgi:hypothetical protein
MRESSPEHKFPRGRRRQRTFLDNAAVTENSATANQAPIGA